MMGTKTKVSSDDTVDYYGVQFMEGRCSFQSIDRSLIENYSEIRNTVLHQ
jgi:hypothetical protein